MWQRLAARVTSRITPGTYDGARAALLPMDVALSFLAKRNFKAYRAWHRWWTVTTPWFSGEAEARADDEALADLRRNGFTRIPDFYPEDQLGDARAWLLELADRAKARPEMMAKPSRKAPQWTEGGIVHEYHARTGHLRFFLTPEIAGDLPPLVRDFMDQPRLRATIEPYLGTRRLAAQIPYVMAEVLSPADHPETWHVDCIRPTVKTFLYLDDVSVKQGPLRVIPGSHLESDEYHQVHYRLCRGGQAAAYFEPADDAALDPRGTPVAGKANTVAMFDTRMLHAGSRCLEGRRLLLVNGYRPMFATRINPRMFRDPAPAMLSWQRNL